MDIYLNGIKINDKNSLAHFGKKGMKWGVRNYQNADGSLTEEGKKRYQIRQDGTTSKKGADTKAKDYMHDINAESKRYAKSHASYQYHARNLVNAQRKEKTTADSWKRQKYAHDQKIARAKMREMSIEMAKANNEIQKLTKSIANDPDLTYRINRRTTYTDKNDDSGYSTGTRIRNHQNSEVRYDSYVVKSTKSNSGNSTSFHVKENKQRTNPTILNEPLLYENGKMYVQEKGVNRWT